jgi:DNA-directed RNA polymerase specialized sigma24 family protein
MTDDQFDAISRNLDILVRLSALSFVAERPQKDQIMMLSNAGFRPKEIADICGTTANTVRVALSTMRKKRGRR